MSLLSQGRFLYRFKRRDMPSVCAFATKGYERCEGSSRLCPPPKMEAVGGFSFDFSGSFLRSTIRFVKIRFPSSMG